MHPQLLSIWLLQEAVVVVHTEVVVEVLEVL
jgi:hypothetical protein